MVERPVVVCEASCQRGKRFLVASSAAEAVGVLHFYILLLGVLLLHQLFRVMMFDLV